MRQSVNLYPSELRPSATTFSARQLLLATAALVAVLTALTTYQGVANYRAQSALTSLSGEAQRLQIKLDTLRATNDVTKQRDALQESQNTLEAEIISQEATLQLLQGQGSNLQGFSPFLYGLARQHEPGVWLESFSFSSGGNAVSLHGKAAKPDLLFSFLNNLGREANYRGKKFNALSLEQDRKDPSLMAFEIGSEPKTAPADEADFELELEEHEDG